MQSVNNQKDIKTHKRNIWFNPHHNKTVKTNIGRCFFHLINKYFPLEHKLHKIVNRNTLKLSYSCVPNRKTLINSHDQEVLKDQPQKYPKNL